MTLARAGLGILFFCAVAWLLSTDRKRIPWRVIVFGVLMQWALAWFILGTETGLGVFEGLGGFVTKLINMTDAGSELVFGGLAKPEVLGPVIGFENGFIFAFKALTAIIFFSALMAILYHLGIMQLLIWCAGARDAARPGSVGCRVDGHGGQRLRGADRGAAGRAALHQRA